MSVEMVLRPGQRVLVRFPAVRERDADGSEHLVELRAGHGVPQEAWAWLQGEVVAAVHTAGCTSREPDCGCAAHEWVVDVLEEQLLRFDAPDDDVGVYPVCFRTAEDLIAL